MPSSSGRVSGGGGAASGVTCGAARHARAKVPESTRKVTRAAVVPSAPAAAPRSVVKANEPGMPMARFGVRLVPGSICVISRRSRRSTASMSPRCIDCRSSRSGGLQAEPQPLGQPGGDEAEHHQCDQHLQQRETAVPAHGGAGGAVPRRRVLSWNTRSWPPVDHVMATAIPYSAGGGSPGAVPSSVVRTRQR